MSDVPTIDPSADAQVDAAYQRLLWTGAAANGALLLTLIGFAGNADNSAAALQTITIPIVCGIIGFTFGGTAISYAVARLAQRPLEAIAKAKIAMAHLQMGAFKEVLTTPAMDPIFAQLVWGNQADDQMRALILGRLAAAKDATDKSPVAFEEAMRTLKVCADEGIGHLRMAQRWLTASFVAAALGVLALVGQAWIAPALPDYAKPAVPAATLAASTAAIETKAVEPLVPAEKPATMPACPGGAPDCEPWERAWKQPPPVGMVVPGRAEPVKK